MGTTADRPEQSHDHRAARPHVVAGERARDGGGEPGGSAVRPGRRLTAPGLMRLQRSAGNAAVARLVARARPARAGDGTATSGGATGGGTVAAGPGGGRDLRVAGDVQMAAAPAEVVQRRADGGHPSPPPEPGPVDPHGDPRFAKVASAVKGTAKGLRAHPAPAAEARKAGDAAVAPPNDRAAQAKAAQADKMAAAKPAGFDKAKFMAAVRSAIAAKAPHNLDEADKFAESGKADGVKSEVMGQVTSGKQASAKDISDKTNAAPDTSVAKDKPVTPLAPEPTPKPSVPATGAAMPEKAPAAQTDLGAGKAETDAQMAEADVTEDQLAKSNEPEFTEALAAKQAGEQHSDTAPAQVRQNEAATLAQATQGATQSGQSAVAGMAGSKTSILSKVAGDKGAAKSKDDAAYQEAAAEMNKIFDATQTEVRTILTNLDTAVATRFDEGEKLAKAAFTADHKARMGRYKEERYSGFWGKGRWLKDKFAGMPAEANNLFLESRKLYESKMEAVISAVADLVGQELTRAKGRIEQGKAQIAAYVKSRPAQLQKITQKAASDVGGKFDTLESEIDEKQEALVDDLAQRYADARNAVDEEIKELQAENRGLWDKAKDAIGGAIKTILKLKDMLLGVLARAAGAIGKILRDPIGFLGNLVNAVKSGVQNFASNIYEHLKKGLQGWLFGALGDAGIELPDSFDLKGIIKLILSILGLTWMRIRTKIVGRIGEAAMGAVEKGVDFFQTLAREGVGGLWRFLIDKLSDLKDTVMGAIQDFVVVKIIKAGITWLISALNPAAAFIKACKMIYDVVMFFVEKGSQIKEFVDSVLDSIESIVGGGVGGVAKRIEDTLSRILPLLIGFLASLLGLGGIGEKIKEIFDKLRKPVEQAVDFVINGALKLARPIINLAKRGAAWVKGKFEKGKAWVKGKVEGAKAWAKDKVDAAKAKLGLGPKPRQDLPEDKQQHVNLAAREIEPKVRSLLEKGVSGPALEAKLRGWKTEYQLTDLWIEHHGENFDVRAKVNPEANIITNAVDAQGSLVSRLLREVGEQILTDPAVRAEVEKIRLEREAQLAQGRGPAADPITRTAQSPAAEAGALREPLPGEADPRRPGNPYTYEQIDTGGVPVTERQGGPKGKPGPAGNVFVAMTVEIEGKLHRSAHYNPEVMAALQQMEASGISRPEIQSGIFNLLGNRPPGPAFDANPAAKAQIAAITRLMFVVEPAREPAAFATSFMGTTMAGDTGMPIEEMATAANPMHVEKAGKKSRDATRRLAAEQAGKPTPRGRTGLDAHLMLMAERDVVIGYLDHLVSTKQLTFDSQQAVERWLQTEFRKHLLERLRALLTPAPAPVPAGGGGA